jgi:hypothetical protein
MSRRVSAANGMSLGKRLDVQARLFLRGMAGACRWRSTSMTEREPVDYPQEEMGRVQRSDTLCPKPVKGSSFGLAFGR